MAWLGSIINGIMNDPICPYCQKNDKNIFLEKKREWLCLNCRRRFTYGFTYGHANKNESEFDIEFDIYECYKILDCTESDTDEIIKKKYRKAVSEYHPDKIQSKDLPKGFHDFANQQMHKINNAYENIKKYRKNT